MALKRGDVRVICGWRKTDKAQDGGGGKTKNSVALRCNRPPGLGLDAWTHFIIYSALKSWVWTACVHTSPSTPVTKSKTNVQVLRTHTGILSIYLGGVDNQKDLSNRAGCSSLYQVLLYRADDRWGCNDGRGCRSRGGYTILDQIEGADRTQAAGQPAGHLVWCSPPEAVGEETNGRVASFSKQWIKVAERKREREGAMLFFSMRENGVRQDARQVRQNGGRFRELANPAVFLNWSRYCCIKYVSKFTKEQLQQSLFLLAAAKC